jgi:outer membrane protein OmpA-like peptidoglycan-associated protein
MKSQSSFYLPKDLFKLALYGTPDLVNANTYDLKNFGVNSSVYTEVALGYSREVNEKLTLGGNLKYLIGQMNISTDIDKFDIEAGIDKWAIVGEGTLNISSPMLNIPVQLDGTLDFNNIKSDSMTTNQIQSLLLTGNWGLGVDLGATYKILPNLELSAAITDLGFIRWRKNVTNAQLNGGYEFTGIKYGINDNIDAKMDTLSTQLQDAFVSSGSKNSYTTSLSTRLNVGAEYSVVKDRIGFGVLSSTLFANNTAFEDVTASVNFRPMNWHWFSSSFSYSLLNGQWSTIGFGVQMRILVFNMYIAADRIPLTFASKNMIPSNLQSFNLQMGWVWNFGNNDKDDDKDGVKNKKDKCLTTPLGDKVDKVGCSIDTDKDGVADNKDLCPDTPLAYPVDSVGCTLDDDKDGVVNPKDDCPDTPQGVKVDEKGCPLDTDGDGVADYKDLCPDTPKEAYGTVDEKGCPKDGDEDGVADYKDKCPGTPAEARSTVDEKGCPKDTDGDGVADYKDKCPGTPAEAYGTVDEDGCPKDTDKDGLSDYLDKCPTVAGPISNQGCPEVKAEVKKLFQQALQGIQFETSKAIIKPKSFPMLDKIVKIMKDNSDYSVEINGHTDNVGNDATNQALSENRATAVMKYLLNKGIDANRMKAAGYGEMIPVQTNTTPQGRALNRRVEFIVKFERFVTE